MTAQPLAPVIPSSGIPASRQRARSAAARRLPLASLVPAPSAPGDVAYGIARIDASGRVCERVHRASRHDPDCPGHERPLCACRVPPRLSRPLDDQLIRPGRVDQYRQRATVGQPPDREARDSIAARDPVSRPARDRHGEHQVHLRRELVVRADVCHRHDPRAAGNAGLLEPFAKRDFPEKLR